MSRTALKLKSARRLRRKRHIRNSVHGRTDRPRLTVFRSLNHIYAQVIDDDAGRTLASAGSLAKDLRGELKQSGNCDAARAVGRRLAELAKGAGVTKVVFDRNGYKYHGRIKALADAAREGGLEF